MDFLANVYQNLQKWYKSDLGSWIYDLECDELDEILQNCFGYHLLQFEGPEDLDWLRSSPIKHKIRVNFGSVSTFTDISQVSIADDGIPFAENSVDVVILPHTLDLYGEPEQLLQEMTRILMPEGKLVIFGFNVYSLWGLWRKFVQPTPECNYYSISRLIHWLKNNDCEVDKIKTVAYRPPVIGSSLHSKLSFMEALGSTCWPHRGGIYMILAHKQRGTLTPLRLMNKPLQIVSKKNITAPTQRSYK